MDDDFINLDNYVSIETAIKAAQQHFPQLAELTLGGGSGRGWSRYCVAPETRVLTADLRWIPAGNLTLGQPLLAFDEFPIQQQLKDGRSRGKRKLRYSRVICNTRINRPTYTVKLEDGSCITASIDHPWLAAPSKGKNFKWYTVDQLVERFRAKKPCYVPKFLTPWEPNDTYDGGYLAGLFDGEGSWSSSRNRGSHRISFAQNAGKVLTKGVDLLKLAGFSTGVYTSKSKPTVSVGLLGGVGAILKFLGEFRPVRLLEKFMLHSLNEGAWIGEMPRNTRLKIVDVVDCGEREVIALETTTKTYFAEGFAAHNCALEQCARKFFFSYVKEPLHNIAGTKGVSLEIGSGVHASLAAFYTAGVDVAREFIKRITEHNILPEVKEEFVRLFEAYVGYYGLKPGEGDYIIPLAAEVRSVNEETGDTCRYDLIARIDDAPLGQLPGYWIIEHKTAKIFDNALLTGWDIDGEVLGEYAFWKLGGFAQKYGPLQGVCVNIVGKQKDPKFHRSFVTPSQKQIDEHLSALLYWREQEYLLMKRGYYPRSTASCIGRYGKCNFYEVCSGY